jgi:hypothetical protein
MVILTLVSRAAMNEISADALFAALALALSAVLLLRSLRVPVPERQYTGWAMSDNAIKTPIGWSLNQFVDSKTSTALSLLTKQLPCHVVKIVSSEIVTVAFDVKTDYTLPQMTVPVATSEYVRLPIQVGDKGFCKGADAYLGGVSGLGGGTADLTRRGNLSALCFQPLGNTNWTTVDNDALTLYGPNGVVIEDTKKGTTITLSPTDLKIVLNKSGDVTITLQSGHKVQIDGNLSVSGNINATGTLTAGTFHHQHSGVQTGMGVSGPPTQGTY